MRTKRLKLSKEPCNLTQVIDETVHMLLHAADKQGRPVKRPSVNLINDLDKARLPIIQADVHRCTQVAYNLLVNALKFTQEGEVRVWGEHIPEAGQVKLHVTDTGVGISKARIPRSSHVELDLGVPLDRNVSAGT